MNKLQTVTEESGTARAEIILGGLPAAFLTQATAPPPGQTDSCSWGGGSGCVRLGLQWARTGAAETKARQLPRASGWRCQERGRKWFVGSGDEAEAVRCGFCPGNLTHVDGAEAPLPQGAVSAITGPGWAGEGGCAPRERPNGASGTQGRPRGPRFPHRRWAEGLWADGSTEANGPEPRRKRACALCLRGGLPGGRLESSPEPQLDSDSPREFGQGPFLSLRLTFFISQRRFPPFPPALRIR